MKPKFPKLNLTAPTASQIVTRKALADLAEQRDRRVRELHDANTELSRRPGDDAQRRNVARLLGGVDQDPER